MNGTEYGVQCNQLVLHIDFRDWVIEPTLKHSLLLLIVILHLAVIAGVLAWVMAFTLADTGQVWPLNDSSILNMHFFVHIAPEIIHPSCNIWLLFCTKFYCPKGTTMCYT